MSVTQASRGIDVHANVLRKWVREFGADPPQAFPGQGQMKPEQLEIDRLGVRSQSSRRSATS